MGRCSYPPRGLSICCPIFLECHYPLSFLELTFMYPVGPKLNVRYSSQNLSLTPQLWKRSQTYVFSQHIDLLWHGALSILHYHCKFNCLSPPLDYKSLQLRYISILFSWISNIVPEFLFLLLPNKLHKTTILFYSQFNKSGILKGFASAIHLQSTCLHLGCWGWKKYFRVTFFTHVSDVSVLRGFCLFLHGVSSSRVSPHSPHFS